MESNVIHHLREWAPLLVLEKIPTKIFNGIFFHDINITSVDAIPEFLALGSDAGLVFWYNRYNAECQKLRIEVESSITCVKIVSSVEYMIAVGTKNGQVNIFQIQKEIPSDLKLISAPLAKQKPIQRFIVRELHKSSITCCEWSKNGMKLYSADKNGLVVLTEFDYQNNISKSIEIINETYSIVQLSLYQNQLLVSTLYRTVICQPDTSEYTFDGKWLVLQIGKKERKILGEFGATFQADENLKPPKIIASRPGFRFWFANSSGVVEQTFEFKDAPLMRPTWEIPLLNPNKKMNNIHLRNFTCIYPYLKKFYITNDDISIYVLNLEELKIEAVARNFRNITDYAVCGNEIFILEGGRSLIRLSNKPEPPNQKSTIIFNPLLPPPIPHMGIFEAPIEFTEDENIISAEECFELPPIETITSEIPIQTHIDSPDNETKIMLAEKKKKIEILKKIGKQDFEDEILYQSATKKSKKSSKNQQKNKNESKGIVEVGQTAIKDQNIDSIPVSLSESMTESYGTKNAGFIQENLIDKITPKNEKSAVGSLFDELQQADLTNKSENSKLDNKSISLHNELIEIHKTTQTTTSGATNIHNYDQFNLPSLNYPMNLLNIETLKSPEEDYESEEVNESNNEQNLNEELMEAISKMALLQSNEVSSTEGQVDQNIPKEKMDILGTELGGRGDQLKRKDIPKHLRIQSIFTLKGEKNPDTESSDSTQSRTSEWEFLDENDKSRKNSEDKN